MYMYMYVYSVHLCTNLFPCLGLNFASGGADKVVIIWTSDPPDGRLKYTHSDSVQCISYNPVSQQLVSCTATEVGRYMYKQRWFVSVYFNLRSQYVIHVVARPLLGCMKCIDPVSCNYFVGP